MQLKEQKNSDNERETRSFSLEMKANDDGSVEGYGSVFSVIDTYADIMAKGSFVNSLKEHKSAGTMPAMLWQHDSDKPIGVWTDMIEDEKGLKVKGMLALDTEKGKEAHTLLKMGALNGLSIGFISREWTYDAKTDIRTLTDVDLWEVSLVTFPANKKSRITSVKSSDLPQITTLKEAEKSLRDAGFSQDAAKVFVSQVKTIAMNERDAHEVQKALKAANSLLDSLKS
jgi:HK97 family phage prohead protease